MKRNADSFMAWFYPLSRWCHQHGFSLLALAFGFLKMHHLLWVAWVSPKSWAVNELLTASNMNIHLRDNLGALKDPPTDYYDFNEGADYTTTSATFADIDATDLALTITTTGGDVFVHFHGLVKNSTTERTYFDVDVDGARTAGDDGITLQGGTDTESISFTRLIAGLSAGAHTFKLQWKVSGGTATLYAGAGTANFDVHPQFWVRELS